MTVNDILNMSAKEISGLNKSELSKLLGAVKNATRLRIKRLKEYERKTGYTSPALEAWMETPLAPRYSRLTLNKMRNEFVKYRNFLNSKTSKLKGVKEYRKTLKKNFGEYADDNNFLMLWSEFKEQYSYLQTLIPSDLAIRIFSDIYERGFTDKEELFKKVADAVRSRIDEYADDLKEDFWDYDDDIFNEF